MSIIDRLTSLFAPDDCLRCGREGALLCRSCLLVLPAPPNSCFGCHEQITMGACCTKCLSASGLTKSTAMTAYQGESKQLVAALKFHGNQSAARLIASVLTSSVLPKNALLTHVPATASHIRQRGFDQSALITREVSRLTGVPRVTVLARLGDHHQLGADRQTRHRQLMTSLRVVRPNTIRGRRIVVIDDVLTTGSSLTVCAHVLKKAGASHVEALVFAQA